MREVEHCGRGARLQPNHKKEHWFNLPTAVVDIVNIKEHRKLTPSDSKKTVVLPLGKLMPSVDYFWKLIYM